MLDSAIVTHNHIHTPGHSAGRCLWEVMKRVTYEPESLYRNWSSLRAFETSKEYSVDLPYRMDPGITDALDQTEKFLVENDFNTLFSDETGIVVKMINLTLKYGPVELNPQHLSTRAKTTGLWGKACNGLTKEDPLQKNGQPSWLT